MDPNVAPAPADNPAPDNPPAPEEKPTPDAAPDPDTQPEPTGVKAHLPSEMHDDPLFDKFDSVEGLAKSYKNAQNMVGAEKIAMPKSDEDYEAAYVKLGRPETPDGYQVERPEMPEGVPYDEAAEASYRSLAHAAGLNDRQFNAIYNQVVKNRLENIADANNAVGKEMEAAQTALEKEWGTDYDARLGAANRAIAEFGGDELVALFAANGLGRNPVVVKAFAKAGLAISGDKGLEGKGGGEGKTHADTEAAIAEIMAKDAYWNSDDAEHATLVKKMQDLQAALNPVEG